MPDAIPTGVPDVGIWAFPNPRSSENLRPVVAACVASGLKTAVLWSEWKGRGGGTPSAYPIPGVRFVQIQHRSSWGPLRYSHPLTLPLLAPAVERALRQVQPRCLVTQLDHAFLDRVLHHAGRRLGIPGVVLQEGMVNVPKGESSPAGRPVNKHWNWTERKGLRRLIAAVPHPLLRAYAPYMFADHVCVWGEAMKRHLVSLGRDPSTVVVTGSPAFDGLRARLPVQEVEEPVVLFAQQRMGLTLEERLPSYRELIRIVCLELKARLLFKLHPNSFQEEPAIRALVSELSCPAGSVEVIAQGDSVDLLGRARVLVTGSSTTAYHGLIRGVPVIVLDYLSPDLRFSVAGQAQALVVADPSQLTRLLGRALRDSGFAAWAYDLGGRILRDHLHELDGGSADRVARAVGRLARGAAAPSHRRNASRAVDRTALN